MSPINNNSRDLFWISSSSIPDITCIWFVKTHSIYNLCIQNKEWIHQSAYVDLACRKQVSIYMFSIFTTLI